MDNYLPNVAAVVLAGMAATVKPLRGYFVWLTTLPPVKVTRLNLDTTKAAATTPVTRMTEGDRAFRLTRRQRTETR